MIDAYLTDALPTLDAIELDKSPTFLEKVGEQLGAKPKAPPVSYGRNPELLDTLWGQYFASGQYRPIWRIMTLLPWSKERDSAERLTVGSSAKYTLANNAARYPDVLAMIKDMAAYQEADVRPILKEVIHAAETTETSAIRKEQLALVDKMKKGTGFQHDTKIWGTVGPGRDRRHLRGTGGDLAGGGRYPLRDRRRGELGGAELLGGAVGLADRLHGLASRIMLTGVSAARRTLSEAACLDDLGKFRLSRPAHRAPVPTSCESDTGTQAMVENA